MVAKAKPTETVISIGTKVLGEFYDNSVIFLGGT